MKKNRTKKHLRRNYATMRISPALSYSIIAVLGGFLIALLVIKHRADLELTKTNYIYRKSLESNDVAVKIEENFKAFYQGLRTMTLLPGVKNIDPAKKILQIDSKKAMQEIYNNTYLNVALSEVYLLPKDFDPDRIDPATNKLAVPILTFDEFITSASRGAEHGPSALEEVEIEEYRSMRYQIAFLKQHYPTVRSFEKLNVPALLSAPVITCDNSEFTREDFLAGNNKPRMGLVYTLPVYNDAGEFSGAVSGIVRLNVLERMLPSGYIAIVNQFHNYFGNSKAERELVEARAFLSKGKADPRLVYSEVRKLDVVDSGSVWEIWAVAPIAEFEAFSKDAQTDLVYWLGLSVAFLFMACSVLGVFVAQKFGARLADQNQKLEERVSHAKKEIEARHLQLASQAKMAALGEMAGGIAHEINNPLGIIQGKASQLRRAIMSADIVDKDHVSKGLTKIEETCVRISKIIKGLKSFSRSADKDPMRLEKIGSILDDTLELCADRLKHYSIELRIIGDRTIEFDCRGTQISQVLLNLIGNARDAILTTSEPWIEVEMLTVNDSLRVNVTDSGHGIPPDIAAKIMNPFFTTKEIGKGTGLGLSLSKGIIEDHGGRFFLDSKYPHTRFVFEIPLRHQNNSSAAA